MFNSINYFSNIQKEHLSVHFIIKNHVKVKIYFFFFNPWFYCEHANPFGVDEDFNAAKLLYQALVFRVFGPKK